MANTKFIERSYGTLRNFFMFGFENPDDAQYWRKQVELGMASEVYTMPYLRSLNELHSLFVLMIDTKNLIAKNSARKSGENGILKIMSKTIKENLRKDLKNIGGAFRTEDGNTFVTNNYFILKTNKEVQVPDIQEGQKFPEGIVKMLSDIENANHFEITELPSLADVKTHIKLKKQEQEKATNVYYSLNNDSIYFYADYLASILEFLGNNSDIRCFANSNPEKQAVSPVFFTNNNGESAALCPVRKM